VKTRDWRSAQIVVFIVVAIIVALLLLRTMPVAVGEANRIRHDKYYTWGFGTEDLDIPVGSIPTEVTITLKGLTNILDRSDDVMYIHLVDNPPKLFIENIDSETGDFFDISGDRVISRRRRTTRVDNSDPNNPVVIVVSPMIPDKHGIPLLLEYHDNTVGTEDVVIKLHEINHDESWVWDVFQKPFNFVLANGETVNLSSCILTFIDYAGSGNAFGLGIDPDGDNDFLYDEIFIDVKVQSYSDPNNYTEDTLSFKLNKAPNIF